MTNNAWKVSKYEVFSGPYFLAFGLNTERYSVSLRILSKCGKLRTRKNSVFGHFSGSAILWPPHLPFISKTDLLFKNHRTRKHLANFTPSPASLFHVDVINVSSLIRVKATFTWKKITFLRSLKLKHMIWKINTAILKKVKKLLTGGVSTCNFQERWIMKYN